MCTYGSKSLAGISLRTLRPTAPRPIQSSIDIGHNLYYDGIMEATKLIYFIQGGMTGLVRIGQTKNIEKHLKVLQADSPVPLTVLKVCETGTSHSQVQIYFLDEWSHGAWFKLSDNLYEYMAKIPASKYDGLDGTADNRCVRRAIQDRIKKGPNYLTAPIRKRRSKKYKWEEAEQDEIPMVFKPPIPMPIEEDVPQQAKMAVISNGAQPLDPTPFIIKSLTD